jgi:hypothetical protein
MQERTGKYKRRYSDGYVVPLLSLAGIVIIAVKLFHIIHGVKAVNNIEKQNTPQYINPYILPSDSVIYTDTIQQKK